MKEQNTNFTILIFAGDFREYARYLQELHEENTLKGIDFPEDTDFINVSSLDKAYGHRWEFCSIKKVGTWFKNDWMHDVVEDIEHRVAIAKGIK